MAQATLTRVLNDIQTLEAEELQMVEKAIRARQPESHGAGRYLSLTAGQIEAANTLLRETIVTLPHATGADNDRIDMDDTAARIVFSEQLRHPRLMQELVPYPWMRSHPGCWWPQHSAPHGLYPQEHDQS